MIRRTVSIDAFVRAQSPEIDLTRTAFVLSNAAPPPAGGSSATGARGCARTPRSPPRQVV